MNAQGHKKAWKRPQLTILVRIDLAESVLQTCKYTNRQGEDSSNNQCQHSSWPVCGNVCSVQGRT